MKKVILALIAVTLFSAPTIHAATWTVLLYADPSRSLTDAIFKNINDLIQQTIPSDVRIYVQLTTCTSANAHDAIAWRYRLHDKALVLEECIKPTGDYVADLTDAAEWAYAEKDTDHYALILSGHGYGILEPTWNTALSDWQLEPDDADYQACTIRLPHSARKNLRTRAVLLNTVTTNYLNNKDMCTVFKYTSRILEKKIDVVALDVCLGSCIEHAYQIAPFVDYLVGCQTCELEDGFDFSGIARHLAAGYNPLQLVQNIVHDYDVYYADKAEQKIYTLSAINCAYAPTIGHLLDELVEPLTKLIKKHPALRNLILEARKSCTNFCFVPMYTDLCMVVEALEKALRSLPEAHTLNATFKKLKTALRSSIVACTAGENITAYGMNIYYPYSHIDNSYYHIPFAQQTRWLSFLQQITQQD